MDTKFSGRVTISFDPAVDKQQEVLHVVAEAYATASTGGLDIGGTADGTAHIEQTVDGWTAGSMYRYVAALKPVARRVLLVILSSSPCPTSAAEEAAELNPRRYAEAHASLQDALRVVPQVGRLPFDLVEGCFTVDEEVAELVVRALDRVENGG